MPENLLAPSTGLSNSKLESANAQPGEVMAGRTFYAGNCELKTGTLSLTGNATTLDVRNGKTFYSNSWTKQTGTMAYGTIIRKIGPFVTSVNYVLQTIYLSNYVGPEIYQYLTLENIIMEPQNVGVNFTTYTRDGNGTCWANINKTYDPATSKLTFLPGGRRDGQYNNPSQPISLWVGATNWYIYLISIN